MQQADSGTHLTSRAILHVELDLHIWFPLDTT